jgi:murein DD-endopeptidase MepM/ murein hydrolase activator NlpD
VNAAATGVVVSAPREGWQGGYGLHVVLAHRAWDGTRVLQRLRASREGIVTVRPGEHRARGERVGRVGRAAVSTAPHLHFEVRIAADPEQRGKRRGSWIPIAYVSDRLPTQRADTTWARPYLEWASAMV